jgi:ribosome-binding factor A
MLPKTRINIMLNRIEKINELIKHTVGDIMLKNLSLKDGVFVTIAKVDTTSDLRYTRVFVSIFPEKETSYVLKTLEKEIFDIQGRLNKKLYMRPLPKIEFRLDLTESNADKIEKILRKL